SEQFSRARILESEHRVDRAIGLLAKGIKRAEAAGDRVWETKMRLRLAQLTAERGDAGACMAEVLPVLSNRNEAAETIVEVAFSRAAAEPALGNAHEASKYYQRGGRISETLGVSQANRVLRGDLGSPAAGFSMLEAVDDAVALLELAGYPHVLAREAYALL